MLIVVTCNYKSHSPAIKIFFSQDYVRSLKVLLGLEKEYELTPVIGSREKLAAFVSTGLTCRMMCEQSEIESGGRSTLPELPIKVKLEQAIDEAVQDHPPIH